MDWTDLSNRLAEGQKVYKAFQDGADAAAMLGSIERARNELQGQYDALQAGLPALKAEIGQIQTEAAAARNDATRQASEQQRVLQNAYKQKLADLQAEYDMKSKAFSDELDSWKPALAKAQAQVEALDTQAKALSDQIVSLTHTRDALKTSLASALA